MDLETFTDALGKGIEEKLGHGYTVKNRDVMKNNGIRLHGLEISHSGASNITPCIFADGYYEEVAAGRMGMEKAINMAVCIYKENEVKGGIDISVFTDYKKTRPQLRGRLVNTEANQEMLRDTPHRDFMDLSLVYTVEITIPGIGVGNALIDNKHLVMWGVGEAGLYEAVQENMDRPGEASFESMAELIGWTAGEELLPDGYRMYVLSNKNRLHGAVQMLNKRMLKLASAVMGGDFLVLPSSIHEVIIVPATADGEPDIKGITDIVKNVNSTEVDSREILSSHVYRYSYKTGQLSIAA